jgi:hypothetical protein
MNVGIRSIREQRKATQDAADGIPERAVGRSTILKRICLLTKKWPINVMSMGHKFVISFLQIFFNQHFCDLDRVECRSFPDVISDDPHV